MSRNKVAVGIITKERNSGLKRLLKSIEYSYESCLDSGSKKCSVWVVVCDNSECSSAKNLIEEIRETAAFDIVYLREEKKGIPFARNKILKYCRKHGYSHLSFLDDDQTVEKGWFENYKESLNWDYDAVFAPVLPVFESEISDRLKETRVYNRKRFMHNRRINEGRTGNCLINLKKHWEKHGFFFNENMKNIGGSDYVFFKKIVKNNGVLGWNDRAVSYEHYSRERASLIWAVKRNYRDGITSFNVNMELYGRSEKINALLVKSLEKIFSGLIRFFILFPLGSGQYYKGLFNLAKGFGIIAAMTGKSYAEYKNR